MAIFRGVGGSGSSSDNSFLQEVTAQATIATNKASEASASATSASASATSAANSLATIQNTEVTSASFNTGDGVLTLTKLGGATVTADLDGRFLTSYTETNDLSSAVTWVNVPNAYITEGSVTQHQAALTITESQISDLQSYLTSYTETNNLTTAVTWANVPDANITESSVTQHLTAANVTSPLTGGTGISIASNGTITNDSPDQTVALTGTGATTVTGTYPNFTIDSTDTTYTVGDGGLTTNDFTDADHAKLNGIEANATADQTDAEIKTAYENNADTNAFTDADHTKLDGIEASADVTDTANVTAAGALMDSEVTNLAQVKAFDSSDYATAAQGSTADSALQNLVEDTTPQLGGDLDLNGNDITGTGNISADTFTGGDTVLTQTGTLASDAVLTLKNTDSGNVTAPHLLFDRVSSSPAPNDGIGSVVFQGRDSANQSTAYVTISAKADDSSNATEDGQLEIYTRKAGVNTKIFDLTSNRLTLDNGTALDVEGALTVGASGISSVGGIYTTGSTVYGNTLQSAGNTTVGGNVIVTGTVDGRDVATDGAKIDAIGRFGYGESQAKGVSGTTTHTMLTFGAPAPASGTVVRSINGSVQIRFYLQNSQTAPRNLTYRTYLEMQSTSQTGISLGTATYSSTPTSYQAWYYVTGNKTDVVSAMRGRVGSSSTGANASSVLACYYDVTNNRTYIRISKYPDAATVFANVEIFYSPTNFYSAGTYVAPYLSNDNYMRLEAINYYDTRLQLFNETFPRTSSALYLRMRHRNTTGSTGVSVLAYNNQGYIEATP